MNVILTGIFEWINDDYKSNKLRFCFEVVAWAISIGCAITMAVTVPNPPFWPFTQYGLLAVLYTLGVLIVGVPLVCLLITSYSQQSIQSD